MSLKQKAEQALKTNPSALGDPISLKAETSSSTHDLDKEQQASASAGAAAVAAGKPGKQAAGTAEAKKEAGGKKKEGAETLKEKAEKNPSMLGDPVSLKAETSELVPTEGDKGAEKGKGRGSKL